jgi:hypothetical protein
MSNHFLARSGSLGTLTVALAATLLFASTNAHAQQDSSGCDRACLRQVLDAYLAGVFKHDPSAARLTDDHYATENTAVVHNGEGFWKDISGYGELQRRYFDPVNQAAAYLGLLKQNGKDVISSVRVKVEGGKVSEAEWFVQSTADPQKLLQYPPPEGALPTSERSSRFYLISMANDYFQSGLDHDSSWIPADLRCKDTEPNPITSSPRHADLCHDNFGIYKNITKDLALRRFPLVDEEVGVVLGAAIWVRYPGVTRPDNMVNEYFQVRNGSFVYIWTCNYELPKGAPVTSGWEDKQGDITR